METHFVAMQPTSEISREQLESFLKSAQAVGFLRGTSDLARLVEVP